MSLKKKQLPRFRFESNILYHNNGDGTFDDVTKKSGVVGSANCPAIEPEGEDESGFIPVGGSFKWSFQPLWFDYNNDGLADLYVTTDSNFSPLYRNNGDGTFDDVTEAAGLCKFGTGMGVTAGDYDDDGDLDLYMTNTGENFFWQNNGDGTFSDVSYPTNTRDVFSLGWGTGFIDFDNDGDLDLYVTNGTIQGQLHNPLIAVKKFDKLYRNNGDGTFDDASRSEGISGNDAKEATAFGDYNNDGFVDIMIISRQAEPIARHRLYQNQGNDNNWLTVRLVGTASNRDAVGAKILVSAGSKTQMREIISGSSFLAQNSLWQTFGLGNLTHVKRIEVRWPSGKVQILQDVGINQKISIVEE